MIKYFSLFLLLSSAFAHKYHKSTLTLNLDAEQLQMILQVDTLDLEKNLRRHLQETFDFQLEDLDVDEVSEEVMSFFTSRLGFELNGQTLSYQWFGINVGPKKSSVYFVLEGFPEAELRGLKIHNTMFFKSTHHQCNYIKVEGQSKLYLTSVDRKIKEVILE